MDDWWRGCTIYQIYPRSFQDSDGDGVGDLPGILRRLPHVASLGVDAIWISPVFTSPMTDMGYDVSDYRDIDPLFGTLADFDAVVAEAHRLGLKVIIDQVLSHSSDQHPWFAESRRNRLNPKAYWYVWTDPRPDGMPPNNWPSVFGGPAWTWDTRRRQYYLHNFLKTQPDLNFHNPEVRAALLDVLRFWLGRGVDGFRLDTVNFYFHDNDLQDNPPRDLGPDWPAANPYLMQEHRHSKTQPQNIAFLKEMRALTDSYGGRTLLGEVGEDMRPLEIMADYTRGPDRLHMAYSFMMLRGTLDPSYFARVLETYFAAAPDGWPCWAFSNHDVARHVSRWAPPGAEAEVAHLCAALLLSMRGTPCLYQGEETGQTQTELEFHEIVDPPGLAFWPEDKGRDGCRTPMVWEDAPEGGFTAGTPWLPVKAPQRRHAVALQEGREGSVLATYRELLAFRRGSADLRLGDLEILHAGDRALMTRRGGTLCLLNLSARPLIARGLGLPVGPTRGVGGETVAPWGWGFFEASSVPEIVAG